jgi:hypothetical protein
LALVKAWVEALNGALNGAVDGAIKGAMGLPWDIVLGKKRGKRLVMDTLTGYG